VTGAEFKEEEWRPLLLEEGVKKKRKEKH